MILKYGPDRVSPAWDSVTAFWHTFLMLANPCHSVTARQVPFSFHHSAGTAGSGDVTGCRLLCTVREQCRDHLCSNVAPCLQEKADPHKRFQGTSVGAC